MRLRIILSFTLIVLVSVSLVVLIARRGAAQEVRAFMFQGGMSGAPGLTRILESYYRANNSWIGVEEWLTTGIRPRMWGQRMEVMGGARLRLADESGVVIADSQEGAALGELLSAVELQASLPLQAGGRTVGYLLGETATRFSLAEESFLLNRLTRAALVAAVIAGGLALLLALLLAYRLLQPVGELTRAAERLAQGDLSQRVQARGDDELATLGRTFNRMADSLQQSEESRRAMTADIAHELRNPLAVQRASLEALQDGLYPLTPENLQPILDQNLLLSRLVDDLRILALADAGQLTLELVECDLVELAGRLLERFQPQAAAQDVSLAYAPPINPIPSMRLDPLRIEQILNNLLSNALRFTPPGGRIAVDLDHVVYSPSGNEARLSVHDSGPGIPAEALPHVFERFYRADRARSRSEGGSGLGLAIARQLAEAHGGGLLAENHPGGGAVFTLRLPVATPTAPTQHGGLASAG